MNLPTPTVLIGTPHTAGLLARQLAMIGTPVHGCVLTERAVGSVGLPPVLGTVDDLASLKQSVAFASAIVSLPAKAETVRRAVSSTLRSLGVSERNVPPLDEVVGGLHTPPIARIASSPEINPAELIGRTPYGVDRRAVARVLEGKRVLITGSGGSIGSELARIVATFRPEELILMERSENALFEVDRQIARRFPGVRRRAILHDVTDSDATMRHVKATRPHAVFHAAAHKHVPLMEDHPAHAVTNNLFGTKSIADAALAAGAERFVLISSDKAVNPTSVMGATKRLAEMYIQALHRDARQNPGQTRTGFSMVRFGNVLGSACSVIPIWQSQVSEGGPLTVTDPRMTRYFMTIHEAAALVIQASSIEEEHDAAAVYVLDMGEPVRILDLAQRLVLSAGLRPRVIAEDGTKTLSDGNSDRPVLDIVITGARPGEKLHEELAYKAELLRPTAYPGIHAWAGTMREDFNGAVMIADLSAVRGSMERGAVIEAIRRHVPEMARPSQPAQTEPPADAPIEGAGPALGLAA